MKKIKVEKVTLNCGCGTDFSRLEKSIKLLKQITGKTPVKTTTQDRNPTWGLRKGLQVGCKVTVRGADAQALLIRLLGAKDNVLSKRSFDSNGNISFGIHECVDIPSVEYDPSIGIIGLEISVTLNRPGFRIKSRAYMPRKVPARHRITQEEAIEFAKTEWKITLKEEVVEE